MNAREVECKLWMVVESRGQGLEVYLASVAKWYACHWSWAGMRVDRGSKGWFVGCYKSGFRADYVILTPRPLKYRASTYRGWRHSYHLVRWQRINPTSNEKPSDEGGERERFLLESLYIICVRKCIFKRQAKERNFRTEYFPRNISKYHGKQMNDLAAFPHTQ